MTAADWFSAVSGGAAVQGSEKKKSKRAGRSGNGALCENIILPSFLSKGPVGFYSFCEYLCRFTAVCLGEILFPAFLVCL